jgi:hypothetical protein
VQHFGLTVGGSGYLKIAVATSVWLLNEKAEEEAGLKKSPAARAGLFLDPNVGSNQNL